MHLATPSSQRTTLKHHPRKTSGQHCRKDPTKSSLTRYGELLLPLSMEILKYVKAIQDPGFHLILHSPPC